MGHFKLDAPASLSLEIALAAATGNDERLRLAEKSARSLSFTGAELDALRQGSSFDFERSRAIALALAPIGTAGIGHGAPVSMSRSVRQSEPLRQASLDV
jgi:hypothetical protein